MFQLIAKMKKSLNNKKGFTIIELMAVFAVLAIVAAIAVPRFTGTVNAAKTQTDKASAQIIARAAEQKYLDDNLNGTKDYEVYGSTNQLDGYLKEVPEPKADDAKDGFIAKLDADGICYDVLYLDSSGNPGSLDLLDGTSGS